MKRKIFVAIYSILIALVTITALYFINLYLNYNVGENGTIKYLVGIIVFTIAIYYTFVFLPCALRLNIYFSIGTIMVLFTMYLFTLDVFPMLIPKLNFLTLSTTESVALMFCGLYLMMYGFVHLESNYVNKHQLV